MASMLKLSHPPQHINQTTMTESVKNLPNHLFKELCEHTLRYIQTLIHQSPPPSPLQAIHLQYISEAELPPMVYYLPIAFRNKILDTYEPKDAYEYIWNPANADYEIPDENHNLYWEFNGLEIVENYNSDYLYEVATTEKILLEVAIALKTWCKDQPNLELSSDFVICVSHVEMHTFSDFFEKINPEQFTQFAHEFKLL